MAEAARPGTGPSRKRGWQIIALAALVAAVVSALSTTSPWRLVELQVFDYFSTASPPSRRATTPIIVAIDEPSLAEIGLQWPWPRDLHAQLITALRGAGAKAIGLDIIFAEPSRPQSDQALAGALGPDVVLAADETLIKTPQADQHIRVDPLPEFTDAGALPGLASVVLDGDGTVRRVPGYVEGFAAQLLRASGREAQIIPAGALIQAFGPARTYQTVSYYQALDPANFLPEGIFRDRTVIVGLSTQSAPTVAAGGVDTFATSFTLRTQRLVAGAELQATIFDNLGDDLLVRPLPEFVNGLAVFAAAALAGIAVWRGTSWKTALAAGASLVAAFALCFLLIDQMRVFVPMIAPSVAFLAVAGAQGARDYAAERRMRVVITRAFSQYLSPVLVQRLADNPAQLKLGGERRMLTILFCDVRGFTTISEQMKDNPEGLTTLINRLLNPLSDVILKSGGTIDKYIGDAIMAFWNAPLDDPDHAVHAVEAAVGMLDAVERLNADRDAEAVGTGITPIPLKIGIGLNSGACVVGNMGSDFRFNYSALGDAVNLAARLESETKGFGVPILLGQDTASHIGNRIPLAELARVTVKGKSEAVAVYAPLPGRDVQLISTHNALMDDVRGAVAYPTDPRFDSLSHAFPEIAGFYQRTRAGLRANDKAVDVSHA